MIEHRTSPHGFTVAVFAIAITMATFSMFSVAQRAPAGKAEGQDYSNDYRGVSLRIEVADPPKPGQVYYVGEPIAVKGTLTNHAATPLIANPQRDVGRPIQLQANYLSVSGKEFNGDENRWFILTTDAKFPQITVKPGAAIADQHSFVPLLPGKVQLRVLFDDKAPQTAFNGCWIDSKTIDVSDKMPPSLAKRYEALEGALGRAGAAERGNIYWSLSEEKHLFAVRFMGQHLQKNDWADLQNDKVRMSLQHVILDGAGFEAIPLLFPLAENRNRPAGIRLAAMEILLQVEGVRRLGQSEDIGYQVPKETMARIKAAFERLVADPDEQVAAEAKKDFAEIEERVRLRKATGNE